PSQQTARIRCRLYTDAPSSLNLIRRMLALSPASWLWQTARAGARRLWGADSLEPDYAAVRNVNLEWDEQDALFRRLQERGDARRMLEVLPKVYDEAAGRLKGILLGRQPLPVAEAQTVVAGHDAAAAGVAAHLLGPDGPA